jgi:pimeloyl-ACP methyl ester carboxylesterase
VFQAAGYAPITPGWPDDPETVAEANANPEVFANKTVGQVADHDEFRYAFANAVSEEEAHELYETYAVPAPGAPLFQAATANLNPWTEAKVDTENPYRGPLLIISGAKDHTVPRAISDAAYKQQLKNRGPRSSPRSPTAVTR